jgi:hypothetical protein
MKNYHLALCIVLLFIAFTPCRKIVGKGTKLKTILYLY